MATSTDVISRLTSFCGKNRSLTLLVGANTIVAILSGLASLFAWLYGMPSESISQIFALHSDFSQLLSHPWTTATYMIVHASFIHLLFNMLWLIWFGQLALLSINGRRLVYLYVTGGLAGAIAFLTFSNLTGSGPGQTFLVGSSAAVLAVMSAAATAKPDLELSLLLIGRIKLKWLAAGCIVLTMAGQWGSNAGGNAAHIGGIAAGIIFAMTTARKPVFSNLRDNHTTRCRPTQGNTENFRIAAEGRLCDSERLDQLLDKIRLSGFQALSQSERNELMAISKRLDNNRTE